jgi:dTDP-4-dehydrorhamnose 3,5-epimerase-like enzyme
MEASPMERATPWRFQAYSDQRGSLVVIEALRDVPFEIKRAFYVYDVPPDQVRGGHAHRACQQALVCVSGGCRVLAGGDEFQLCDPAKVLYVPPGVHLDLDKWQPGTVLLVLCSQHYDEEDYVIEPD